MGNRVAIANNNHHHRLGGLGLVNPARTASQEYEASVKVSATLKIAIFPYLRFQRFQIDMLESFLLKKKIRRKYYFCRKISGVKDFFSLIILIDR